MKQHNRPTVDRARQLVAISLAALMTASSVYGQSMTPDEIRRLQEENASLKRRLAELEANTQTTVTPAPASTTAPVAPAPVARATSPATPTLATDEGVVALSPFEVRTEKDYGYLKTNAVTATKIGMAIQDVPLNISVISREFLDDTNAKSLTDLFRYQAAASGDTRFAMRVPANEATPQGGFTMRGFSVNTLMRDGILRYSAYNLDNVERVEVVKGPASVFFGQGYPGGVINYVTKKASLTPVPTTVTYKYDDNGGQRVQLDDNSVLSKKAALRVVGGWEDTTGERRYEFKKNFNITPSLTVVPFETGKLKLTVDFEYLRERFNYNDWDWIYSDFDGWRTAARTGQYGTSTATLSNSVVGPNGTTVVQSTDTPSVAYATYINNKRIATGDFSLPAYTSVKRGAYIGDANGRSVYDEAFNFTSRGSWSDNQVRTLTAAAAFAPFSWLTGQYAYTRDHSTFNNFGNGAVTTPYADGIHWNVGLGAGGSGYWRTQDTHTADLVFSKDFRIVKNKVLVGFQHSAWRQQYLGKAASSDVNLAFLPGARNPTSNPNYAANPALYDFGQVPVNQVIRQRDGSIKPVRQIYSNWDPGTEIYPDISVYWQDDRNALDGYRPTLQGHYINYQGKTLNDRLTVLAGYREEKRWERWQDQSNNYPWFVYTPDMITNPDAYPEDVWGNSKSYQRTIPLDQKGRSAMAGASFALTKDVSVYASWSKVFKFNAGNVGGFFPGDEALWFNELIAAGSGGTPGRSFSYLGNSITTLQQFQDALRARGAFDNIKNEAGNNWEVGAKVSAFNNKLVGTLSFFRGERENQRLDDGAKQSNLEEPLNFSTTLFNVGSPFRNARLLRWRTTDLKNRIEGSEAEVIWTPMRNFQAVVNGSWLWTAKTVFDKTRPMPGSAAYNALSAAGKISQDIYYKARIENVPEYRFNAFGKYTLSEGFARGLQIGGGMRYSSKTVVSRAVDWNPLAGGYQAGDYVVFDATLGYAWELFGYRLNTTAAVYNLLDEEYSEGSFVMSPARNWVLSTSLKF